MHAAHIHCTCNTGNPDETGSSCSCHTSWFRRMPQHQSLWHPMPHLCSHKDLAVPAWHQDAWSRRSRNCWPGLSMDLVSYCTAAYIPSKSIFNSPCIIISERGMSYDQVALRFKNCSHCSRPVDESSYISWHLYISVPMSRCTWSSGWSSSKHNVDTFKYL